MDDAEFHFLVPRAVGFAVKLRRRIDDFHPHVYHEDAKEKIGYGYSLEHGITDPVAITLIKSRLVNMGHALMVRAFETNLASDPARFSAFIDIAERTGENAVLEQDSMWKAAKDKDYWALHEAFLVSSLILAYGHGVEGRRRVAYIGRVLVEGEKAI